MIAQIDWKAVIILISPSVALAIIGAILYAVNANLSFLLISIAINIIVTVFVIDRLIRYRQE
jgi:uncharacterized membrane protein YfcA